MCTTQPITLLSIYSFVSFSQEMYIKIHIIVYRLWFFVKEEGEKGWKAKPSKYYIITDRARLSLVQFYCQELSLVQPFE